MTHSDHLSGRVFAAARVLAGLSQTELAQASNVSTSTVKRVEASDRGPSVGVMANNLAAIRTALEAAGVVFLPENGNGPGVALRKAPTP